MINQSAQSILATLFTTILLICTAANAQQKQAGTSTSTLAIEIVEDDSPKFPISCIESA